MEGVRSLDPQVGPLLLVLDVLRTKRLRMFDIGDSEFLPIRLAAGDVEDAGNLEGLRMEAWL